MYVSTNIHIIENWLFYDLSDVFFDFFRQYPFLDIAEISVSIDDSDESIIR